LRIRLCGRLGRARRHDADEAVTARMAPFVERRYVFTGNGVFVCKTNVGQQGCGYFLAVPLLCE
jgi:hypothetical protein